jgi:hypothetical protein
VRGACEVGEGAEKVGALGFTGWEEEDRVSKTRARLMDWRVLLLAQERYRQRRRARGEGAVGEER